MRIDNLESQVHDFSEVFTLPDFSAQLPPILRAVQDAPVRQADLRALHDSLVDPFRNCWSQAERTDLFVAKVAPPASAEAAIAGGMLNYGYCSHYFTGAGVPTLPVEPSTPHFRAYTLVAIYPCGETPLVLGTLQAAVGSTVPALTLYEPAQGRTLPHLVFGNHHGIAAPIGEIRRFSVNPLLEAMPAASDNELKVRLQHYRTLICSQLYELAVQIFRTLHVHFVYLIASPPTRRFFTRSGITMHPLEGMRLTEGDEVRTIQQNFAGYWRPQAPLEQQPALYQIPLPAHDMAFASEHETGANQTRQLAVSAHNQWPAQPLTASKNLRHRPAPGHKLRRRQKGGERLCEG